MKKTTICALMMAAFSAMLGLGIISPFLPEFAKQHGVNGFWIGMVFAGFGISRGLIMPIVGKLSDRIGRKIFVTTGLFLYAVISLFYTRVDDIYGLATIRIIHGFAAGLIMPIVMAYVGEFAEKGKEGFTTGVLNTVFSLGLGAGPLLGGYLNQTYGFDSVFYFMSGLSAVTFFIALFLLPETRGKGIKPKEEKPALHFKAIIKYNFIKAVLIIAVMVTAVKVVFISFVPSLAAKLNMDPDHIGIVLSVGIFAGAIFQIPCGKLSDRLSSSGKLMQIAAGTSVGMLALLVMPFCPSFTALLVAGALIGIGAAFSTPPLMSFSVNIGQNTGMGTWMGILNAAFSVGLVFAPLIAGVLMDRAGIDSVFYVFALIMFFGGLLSFYYIRRRFLGYKVG